MRYMWWEFKALEYFYTTRDFNSKTPLIRCSARPVCSAVTEEERILDGMRALVLCPKEKTCAAVQRRGINKSWNSRNSAAYWFFLEGRILLLDRKITVQSRILLLNESLHMRLNVILIKTWFEAINCIAVWVRKLHCKIKMYIDQNNKNRRSVMMERTELLQISEPVLNS